MDLLEKRICRNTFETRIDDCVPFVLTLIRGSAHVNAVPNADKIHASVQLGQSAVRWRPCHATDVRSKDVGPGSDLQIAIRTSDEPGDND